MNEKELKEAVAGILAKVIADNQAVPTATVTAKEKPVTTHVTKTTKVEEGLISDITEVDLRKQSLLKNVIDPEALLKVKALLLARLGVGHARTRYMTSSTLRLRAGHAAAQDAVSSNISEDLVKEMNFISTETICNSKDGYLTRPDYGHQFDKENNEIIRRNITPKIKIQMVIGDGLSSATIEASIKGALPAIRQELDMYSLDFDGVVSVKYCRVPAMNKIGEIADVDIVCLLVGEHPGLVAVGSMSAYIAYKPTIGMPEARRTVTSNIHRGGTPAVEAGTYIAEIIKKMSGKKKSGTDLKKTE